MINLFSAILYTLICSMFVTALLANVSGSQFQRQRRMVAFFIQAAVFLSIFFFFFFTTDYPSILGINFLAFGVVIPQLIARLIIQRRMKDPKFQLKINLFTSLSAAIGIAFMLLLTVLSLIPNRLSSSGDSPIYDTEYFVSRISFLLATIPAIIFYFISAIQRTTFYSEGLLHNGLFWAWSDLQTYSWKKKGLSLLPNKNLWIARQINLKIPSELKEEFESFLAQRLKKGSESA